MFEVQIGDPVVEISSGRVGILKDIKVVPNDNKCSELTVLAFVYMKDRDTIAESTINNWKPFDGSYPYQEFYPSIHMCRMSDKIIDLEKVLK